MNAIGQRCSVTGRVTIKPCATSGHLQGNTVLSILRFILKKTYTLKFHQFSQRYLQSILLIATVFSIFAGCSSEDDSPPAQYLVVNNMGLGLNISLYDYHSRSFTESIYASAFQPPTTAIKVAKQDNDVVFATSDGGHSILIKVDLKTGEEVKRVKSWIYYNPFIGFHNDQIVTVEDLGYHVVNIKVYDENLNLADSIMWDHVSPFATTIVGNKLLLSTFDTSGDAVIQGIDLTTKQALPSIALNQICVSLNPLGNDRLLGVTPTSYVIIDTEKMQVVQNTQVYLSAESISVDAANNTAYFLGTVAQPANYRFYLGKLDLLTGEISRLLDNEALSMPLLFDPKSKLIITGDLKVFSTTGKTLDEVSVPSPTKHLFVK
jgi:hypothetical protein